MQKVCYSRFSQETQSFLHMCLCSLEKYVNKIKFNAVTVRDFSATWISRRNLLYEMRKACTHTHVAKYNVSLESARS